MVKIGTKMETSDAALELGTSIRIVQRLAKDGRLPAVKLGRNWIIDEKDLDLVRDRKPGRAGWRKKR